MTQQDMNELIELRMSYDSLFARLFNETKQETDPNKFELGSALVSLVLEGRVAIIQSPQGELLFEHNQPN